MKDIDWVFFDLGYTLINEDGSHAIRMSAALEELAGRGIEVSPEEFIIEAKKHGAKGKSPMIGAAKSFGTTVPRYTPDYEEPYPDAESALTRIGRRYKVGIISNQTPGTAGRLIKYRISEYFDAVFASDEVGLHKPAVEFYEYALKETKCPPSRALMVGDRLDNDIRPAKLTGMRTARIMRGMFVDMVPADESSKPDITINGLDELADLLGC